VRRWLKRLVPRMADGVQVTVHTPPQEDGTTAAGLLKELEAAGCRLSVRERMHEKVLIIDGTVLWHGSLNLLANSGPTDLMMRITDPDSCERVRRIVESARMERPARTPPWKAGAREADRTFGSVSRTYPLVTCSMDVFTSTFRMRIRTRPNVS
jgi:hypothetical protein